MWLVSHRYVSEGSMVKSALAKHARATTSYQASGEDCGDIIAPPPNRDGGLELTVCWMAF